MKKKILLFLFGVLCFVTSTFSQNVGIGTNNPQNKLHVAGGFRLDTLANNVDSGLLRHNKNGVVYSLKFTGNTADVLRGDGTFGAPGDGSPATVWKLNGNSGIDPATDFLGTTDSKPLLFRMDNQPAGRIFFTNAAIGYLSFFSNTNGIDNTAMGEYSLYSNTVGAENTAIGNTALYSNTTGRSNTAIGIGALYHNTESENTAVGAGALTSNTTGYYNTSTGTRALASNNIGIDNTATGFEALYASSSGGDNTAFGTRALTDNTTGEGNTAVGSYALAITSNSNNNTAVGSDAGGGFDNGWNNVFIGEGTQTSGNGYYNVIAIGQGTVCTSVSQVTIGNSSTTAYRAYANWTNISDGRYKKDVREDVPGLAFINKLRPVTYTLDATGLDNFLHKNVSSKKQTNEASKAVMSKSLNEKEQVRYTGFVAQEVEETAKKLGFDFSGVDAPKNTNDVYGLRYAEFVVPLVKAVQEQQQQIEELKKQNANLLKRIEKLESSISTK